MSRYRYVFCLIPLILISGCTKSNSPAPSEAQEQVGGETDAEKCRRKLAGGIKRLDPRTLALQANPERSINGINAWLAGCASDELEQLELDEAALSIVDNNLKATSNRFTASDALYIRDCLLLRDVTNSIFEQSLGEEAGPEQDAAGVEAVFDWVMRNITLLADFEERPPLGLFDIMLTGRGTAEDRAWIFAEALRQQQIDAVIVRPNTDPTEDSTSALDTASWLVAVILHDSSLLFDVVTGLPVADERSSGVLDLQALPVTVLRDHPRWKKSSVEVIAQTSAFAPRMLVLQQQLAVEDSAVLYEELNGSVSEIRPILTRIEAAAPDIWKADRISIWSYPEDVTVASQSLSEEQQQERLRVLRPFDAPFERSIYSTKSIEELTTVPEELSDEERRTMVQQRLIENFNRMLQSSEEMFGRPSQRLLKTRILQLLGAPDSGIIQQYQQIRIASMESVVRIQVPEVYQQEIGTPVMTMPVPPMIRELNLSSTGSALYWTAIHQVRENNVGAAITTFINYRRQYPDGQWKYASMINQALALLEQDRVQDAVEMLKQADTDKNPERLRVKRMLDRLSAVQK